jgi:hypothetical protein
MFFKSKKPKEKSVEKRYFFIELYKALMLTVIAGVMVFALIKFYGRPGISEELNNALKKEPVYTGAGLAERSAQINRDAMFADLTSIASLAQQYYKKSKEFGGGGKSFEGWMIPPELWSNDNGSYNVDEISANSVTLSGDGTFTLDQNSKVKVELVVGPDKILSRKTIR